MSAPGSEVNLHDTTDASVWAKEFCKLWPTALSQVPGREGVETEEDFEGIMLGWFANAIMAGVDSENRRARNEALEEAARIAYAVCAETRHVTLGDKARDRILALKGAAHEYEEKEFRYCLRNTTYTTLNQKNQSLIQ